MSDITCANCGRHRKHTATFDEREELYFCDDDCWQSWAVMNHEKALDYYRQCNVVDDVSLTD